jgi:hypothetical protein
VRGAAGRQFPPMAPFWLLAQGRTLPDTVVMRMVPPDPSWFERITGIASGITSLLPYLLLLALVVAAVRLRTSFEQTRGTLDGATKDLRELVDAANRLTQDVAEVAALVREDLAEVHGAVAHASRRTRAAVDLVADRVEAFTETVAVVQDEADRAIITGLSTLRGIGAGVKAGLGPRRRSPAPASDPAPTPRLRRSGEDAPRPQRGPRIRRPRRDD